MYHPNCQISKHFRSIFTGARFELLDTIVKCRKFNPVTYNEGTCINGNPMTEDVTHILFENK